MRFLRRFAVSSKAGAIHRSKILATIAIVVSVMAYAVSEGAFCKPHSQTRIACENHTGFCEVFAWNYKIYYTKNYDCCYNDGGQFTHKTVTGTAGPTSPMDGDCCQDLVTLTFDDGQWTLPCPQTETPPSGGSGGG